MTSSGRDIFAKFGDRTASHSLVTALSCLSITWPCHLELRPLQLKTGEVYFEPAEDNIVAVRLVCMYSSGREDTGKTGFERLKSPGFIDRY